MKALKALKSLKKYYAKDKKKFVLLAITMLVGNIEVLFFAAIWGFVLESLMAKKFFEAILLLLLQLVLFVFDVGIDNLITYLQSKLEKSVLKNVQADLFKKITDFPARAFEEYGVGELNNRIIGDTDQIVSLVTDFMRMISRFISAFIIIFVFFKIHIILGIEMVIFAIGSFIISKYFSEKMKTANKKLKEDNDQLMKDNTQILSGIREVKALGIKKKVFEETDKKLTNVFESSYKTNMLAMSHYGCEWVVYATFEFMTLFTAAFLFYKELIPLTVIVMVNSYLGRINWAVNSYTTFIKDYQRLTISLERVDEILNDKMYKPEIFGNKTLNNINGEIVYKNVSLTYDGDEKATLNNVNLTIKPNKKTAIVGASGSGKTSLFNLLLRYFNPTKGSVTIDGIDLLEISEPSLREHVSVIRQDTFLFNMSIMDNFKMVKEDITLKEVRTACKKAYIDSYIMDLPNGYDTIIGENGVNLSGGQKQRLSIARALIRDTKIILFDEATSALDNKSQSFIKRTINNLAKDHTVIIIAHRLSTIVDADEIILMEKGKVADVGNHKFLMKNESYKELYQPDIIE